MINENSKKMLETARKSQDQIFEDLYQNGL